MGSRPLKLLLVLSFLAGSPLAVLAAGKVDQPAQGRLLIAKRHMQGPVFGRSVVLLLKHDRNGSLGVILNRRTTVAVAEALPDLGSIESPARLYFGGPVGVEYMVYLVRGYEPDGAAHVFEDVYFGGDTDSLRGAFAGGQDEARIRVFGGVAGWAPGQLDNELARGDWFVVEAAADLMFGTDPDKLWGLFIDRLQRPPNLAALLPATPGAI